MEYDKKFLTAMRVKLNSGDYSETWYRNHFRGMIDCIEQHLENPAAKDAYRKGVEDMKESFQGYMDKGTKIPEDMTGYTDIF